MTTPRIEEMVESTARALSQSVRTYSGYGQYEDKSPEQEAYLNGIETAIGMMYIDLTGSPKSKGVLKTLITQAHQAGIDEVVEEYQKKFVGGGPDGDDIAVMEWLRTLLTKHEAAVLEREAQYEELLSAVETKYEGETRHQTALKYILEAEDRSTQPQSTADHLRGE